MSKFFSRLTKLHEPVGRVKFVVFEKNLQVLIYSKLHLKSCDYVLIMYMKKYEAAYHNYAEEKRAHHVQK